MLTGRLVKISRRSKNIFDEAAAPAGEDAPRIEIEVTIADLSGKRKAKFGHYIAFLLDATSIANTFIRMAAFLSVALLWLGFG